MLEFCPKCGCKLPMDPEDQGGYEEPMPSQGNEITGGAPAAGAGENLARIMSLMRARSDANRGKAPAKPAKKGK